MSRLTPEREAEIRRYGHSIHPADHVIDLLAELDGLRVELAAVKADRDALLTALKQCRADIFEHRTITGRTQRLAQEAIERAENGGGL